MLGRGQRQSLPIRNAAVRLTSFLQNQHHGQGKGKQRVGERSVPLPNTTVTHSWPVLQTGFYQRTVVLDRVALSLLSF